MTDFVVAVVLLAIVGAAVAYIVRQKRAGVKCIGCAVGQECADRAKAAQGASGECGCCSAVDSMVANMEKSVK